MISYILSRALQTNTIMLTVQYVYNPRHNYIPVHNSRYTQHFQGEDAAVHVLPLVLLLCSALLRIIRVSIGTAAAVRTNKLFCSL